jgi:uncharacterized protein YciI
MFLVILRFSRNRDGGPRHMDGHKAWIQQGFREGVFLVAGSLHGNQGGAVLAHNTTLAQLESRVRTDPFVTEDVVSVEIVEFSVSRTDERLTFLQQG